MSSRFCGRRPTKNCRSDRRHGVGAGRYAARRGQHDRERRGQEQMSQQVARHRWLVLAVVGAAFFMTILDVAIVTVAIPSIQKDLHIAESTVQWTLTAYAITFGGFLLGGILTKYLGWEWIFFVNVPVGVLVLALTRPIVPESHADLGHRRFDVPGAISVTAGLALFVYAISKAPDVGWESCRTICLLVFS